MIKCLCKITALLALFFIGCTKPKDDLLNLEKFGFFETNISPLIFINSNEFLDIPYSAKQLSDPTTEFTDEDKAKIKAVLYRFYSNIKVEDGVYKIFVKNGKEINVSDRIFELLESNIHEVNQFIKDTRTQGTQIEVPLITSDYLDMLSK